MARRIDKLQINALNASNNQLLVARGGELAFDDPENIFVGGSGQSDVANVALLANVANTVVSIDNFTTANLAEGTNLYYTNARVQAHVATLGYLTSIDLTGNTTTDLAEGTNLYYTNARVLAYLEPSLILKANISDLTTANVTEVDNLYYTNTRVQAYLDIAGAGAMDLSGNTTTDLAEGTNLYYTNARVQAYLTQSDITTQNLTVAGNLIVQGDTTTLNTATLVVEDKNIVLANGAASAATADGAGITIDGANANIVYREAGDKFTINKNLNISGNVIFGNGSGGSISNLNLIQANIIQVGSSLTANGSITNLNLLESNIITANIWNNLYTANVIETTDYLYYTNTKVQTYLNDAGYDPKFDINNSNTTTYLVTDTLSVALTTPNLPGNVYALKTFVITNISSNTAYLKANLVFSTGLEVVYANAYELPYGYSTDLVNLPEILPPNTRIKLQALNSSFVPANNTLSAYATFTAIRSNNFTLHTDTINVRNTASLAYTSNNAPSILETIKIVNHSPRNIRATVLWLDSNDSIKTYIASNTLLAGGFYTDVLENSVRLEANDRIKIAYYDNETITLTSFVSAKSATSVENFVNR